MSYDKWLEGIKSSSGNPVWNDHDCDIQLAVNEYNRHLGTTPGFSPLDWRFVKAMLWTETGGANPEWKKKPMQIGVPGDAGMMALLGDKEGGKQIMPPNIRALLSSDSIRTNPSHNIRGGIGYMLMRMAKFAYVSVREPGSRVEEVKVGSGDNFDKIASANSSTIEVIRELNPRLNVLHKGDVVKFQMASMQKVIAGWRQINAAAVMDRYNGRRDPRYAEKVNVCLTYLKGRDAQCAS
ncbi:lytic transglycosylase domain-containing protein [Massilia rubra]|uniref:lytic transglycosylase domain-containing protein n=1 Tax=Massilia rubra TaxID=2607910 RepID=UPI001E4119DD|nr:lytic transglycosylase domain-containing protein [Massilia rubra]